MIPKSITNRSKSSFQVFLFPHRFSHRFLIDFSSQLRPTGSPKSMFFLWKNAVFFKKTPFEDNIDFGFYFGANLPPCWPPKSKIFKIFGVPRGIQRLIFFGIDFLLILAPSWPSTWGQLGGQDGSNSKKWALKTSGQLLKSGSGYEPALEDRSRAF